MTTSTRGKVFKKIVVVDADVACKSGLGHEDSRACMDVLERIRIVCHRVAVSTVLLSEWNVHRSTFFAVWHSKMVSLKKTIDLYHGKDKTLRERLKTTADNKGAADNMLKDAHLLEVAMCCACDDIVISCDEVRRHYAKAVGDVGEIGDVMWVNPCKELADILTWLDDGAPEKDEFKLKNYES